MRLGHQFQLVSRAKARSPDLSRPFCDPNGRYPSVGSTPPACPDGVVTGVDGWERSWVVPRARWPRSRARWSAMTPRSRSSSDSSIWPRRTSRASLGDGASRCLRACRCSCAVHDAWFRQRWLQYLALARWAVNVARQTSHSRSTLTRLPRAPNRPCGSQFPFYIDQSGNWSAVPSSSHRPGTALAQASRGISGDDRPPVPSSSRELGTGCGSRRREPVVVHASAPSRAAPRDLRNGVLGVPVDDLVGALARLGPHRLA